jgi:hypothetical protein
MSAMKTVNDINELGGLMMGGDVIGFGNDLPVDTTPGWAEGALFWQRGVGLFMNTGTPASCDFDAIDTV